jgi:regulatory protein
MRSSPRKISTEDDLYIAALNSLTRRPRSVHEMKVYLEQRAADPAFVPRIMARLKDHKYLDDARYARQFVRARAAVRKQGKFRIARDLRARGIPDHHIESALKEMGEEIDESAVVRARIARRLKTLRGPFDRRRAAAIMNSLLRAGFSSDTIRREIRAATKTETPDVTDEPPAEN